MNQSQAEFPNLVWKFMYQIIIQCGGTEHGAMQGWVIYR